VNRVVWVYAPGSHDERMVLPGNAATNGARADYIIPHAMAFNTARCLFCVSNLNMILRT
jgi:hypothetical protein